jgi:MFS family permease
MDSQLQNNVYKIYLMAFCRSAMLIAAVFVPLLQRHGLSMSQVMQTQALFALTVAFGEVPSGYLADLWGRKNTLVCGAAVNALAFALLLGADGFADFLVFEFLLGVGMSLNSGADLALLYDTQSCLERRGKSAGNANTIARLFAMDGLAGAGAAVAAGVLTLWSLDWVIAGQALVGLLPLVFAVTLVEAPREISAGGHGENLARIRQAVVREPLVTITAVAMIVFALAGIYVFWIYQKYWESRGVPLAAFGYLWAAHCLVRGLAAYHAGRIEARLGARKALVFIAALGIGGLLGMALLGGWAGIAVGLVMPLSRGLSVVIFADALNRRLGAEFRATVNSLVSLGFRAVFIVTAPALGWLIDARGVDAALLALAAVLAPLYLGVLVSLFGALKRTGTGRAESAGAREKPVQ